MPDEKQTVAELKALMKQFVKERNWEKYHNPKNLSMSISIEAAELMEIFQWLTPEEALAVKNDEKKFSHTKEEVCDIICYCLSMANALSIDLSGEIEKKMEKNRKKYPKDQFYGNYSNENQ